MTDLCYRADCSRCSRRVCLAHDEGRTCEGCGLALCPDCECPDCCEDGAA